MATLVFLLHFIESAPRDAVEEVLEVCIPSAIVIGIDETLACDARPIVLFAPLFVAENGIGETYLLETRPRACAVVFGRANVFVRMTYEGKFSIRFPDVFLGCV